MEKDLKWVGFQTKLKRKEDINLGGEPWRGFFGGQSIKADLGAVSTEEERGDITKKKRTRIPGSVGESGLWSEIRFWGGTKKRRSSREEKMERGSWTKKGKGSFLSVKSGRKLEGARNTMT